MPVYYLKNVIHPYAWGSFTAIAELLGKPVPSAHPEAELWMGTHPKGPSSVIIDGAPVSLAALIERDPDGILGASVSRRFDGHLPFLFKVLAADQPLSIQAHPDKDQAREGFLRENQQGKAMDADDRNYRDAGHKPEIICALTPFWALAGFRQVQEAVSLIEPICPKPLLPALARMKTQNPEQNSEKALGNFFKTLMTLDANDQAASCGDILEKVNAQKNADAPVYRWIAQLAAIYPQDMGILAPAFLNLVCLEPGQALYLPARSLHAYLKGTGIELMASSDNVLRGGLTSKHVDVPELMRVVWFAPTDIQVLTPEPVGPGEMRYLCKAAEFSLSVIRTSAAQSWQSPSQRNVDIVLCTQGRGHLVAGGNPHGLEKGDSVLIPADTGAYQIEEEVVLYKATVPNPDQS